MRRFLKKVVRNFGFFSKNSSSVSLSISENNLSLIKEKLKYKAFNNHKLSASEKHLLRNLDTLNSRLFAPSCKSVFFNILTTLVKPAFVFALIIQFGFSAKNRFYKAEDLEQLVTNGAVKLSDEKPLDLAQFITEDKASTTINSKFPIHYTNFAPKKNLDLVVTEKNKEIQIEEPSPETLTSKEERELIRRQNLVKFISGLITAFRPTLNEPGEIAQNIIELSSKENFNPFYLAAVISIESRFISNAESYAGAVGLMQILPSTAKHVASQNYSKHGRNIALTHPKTNIKLGIDYLKYLEEKYSGNKYLALAAYNWGPGKVDGIKANFKRVPGSVQNYATTILKRAAQWQSHYNKANQIADSLTIKQ